MSEKLGPLTFGKRDEQIFLGREIAKHKDYSEETAVEIDQEVRRIVTDAYSRAREILSDNRRALVALAESLLVREVLDSEQIKILVEGGELPPLSAPAAADAAPPSAPAAEESTGTGLIGGPVEQPS
jgi:cell division protease FtsH